MIYKITVWAAKNRKFALVIMVFLHLILIVNGILTGKFLFESGIIFDSYIKYVVFASFLFAAFFYPIKAPEGSLFRYDRDTRIFKYSFIRHKSLDLMITVSTFIFIIFITNNFYADKLQTPWFITETQATEVYIDNNSEVINSELISEISDNTQINSEQGDKRRFSVLKDRKVKKQIAKQLKKKNKTSDGGLIGAIILIMLISLAATFGLFVLSCYIMCSGFELLGGILLFGGFAGLLALSIFFVKKLVIKREKGIIVE